MNWIAVGKIDVKSDRFTRKIGTDSVFSSVADPVCARFPNSFTLKTLPGVSENYENNQIRGSYARSDGRGSIPGSIDIGVESTKSV